MHRHVFRPSQDSSVWLRLTSKEQYIYIYIYIYIYERLQVLLLLILGILCLY